MPRPPSTRPRGNKRAQYTMRPPRASGAVVPLADYKAPPVKEDWQEPCYRYADAIGEIAYVTNLKANLLSKCVLRPVQRIPGTLDDWEPTTDARVLRVAAALQPPIGGQGQLLSSAAYHYDVAGESLLVGTPKVDEFGRPAGLVWEFLSVKEIEIGRDGKVIRNAWGGSKGKEPVEVNAFVQRLWRPDPLYSQRAVSSLKHVLTTMAELTLLTQVIDAIASSRLNAGIFFVPWEISFGPDDEFANPGTTNTELSYDEFEQELRTHLTSPKEDPSAPSSLLPLLMRGPGILDGKPTKDLMGIVDLSRDLDDYLKDLRTEALHRLAGGLDIPLEIMKGRSTLSGLGGGSVSDSIDDSFINEHVIPPGLTIAGFLSTSYMRPMLAVYEQMTPDEASWFKFELDPAEILGEADRSDAATVGYQSELISAETWRGSNNFDESEAPTPEELFRREILRLAQVAPVPFGLPLLPLAFPDHPEVATALERVAKQIGQPGGPAISDGRPLFPGASLSQLDPAVRATVLAAADRELDAAVRTGANRLIARMAGVDRDEAQRLRATPRHETLSYAGTEALKACGMSTGDVFDGCWDELVGRVTQWLTVALTTNGIDTYTAAGKASIAATELAQQLTHHAATAFVQPVRVGANGFKVPDDLVDSAFAAGDLIGKVR